MAGLKVLLLPDRRTIYLDLEMTTISELLRRLGFDEDDVFVVVNNHIIEDLNIIVRSGDDVKFVRASTGG